MTSELPACRIRVVCGDITALHVDAIVNAANPHLGGGLPAGSGGGVDGAIHRAAGPELLAECLTLGGCETGDAKITGAYRLKSDYVIHTVGPRWSGGSAGEEDQLASCYLRALAVAEKHGVRTVAFPSISTGSYGYPVNLASRIAIQSINAFLSRRQLPQLVLICCCSDLDARQYQLAIDTVGPTTVT
jgi:O-acetyl-ADP-ribose deacetylase (regulator of RNase III)